MSISLRRTQRMVETTALVALLWYVFAVQVWSASSGMRLKPRLSGRFAPGDRLYAVAVAASTQVDARRKAFQRRFQSLNAELFAGARLWNINPI